MYTQYCIKKFTLSHINYRVILDCISRGLWHLQFKHIKANISHSFQSNLAVYWHFIYIYKISKKKISIIKINQIKTTNSWQHIKLSSMFFFISQTYNQQFFFILFKWKLSIIHFKTTIYGFKTNTNWQLHFLLGHLTSHTSFDLALSLAVFWRWLHSFLSSAACVDQAHSAFLLEKSETSILSCQRINMLRNWLKRR